MRFVILFLTLGACTPSALVMTADQVREMCQADPETAIAIAERFDGLTDLDGPAIVARVCDE